MRHMGMYVHGYVLKQTALDVMVLKVLNAIYLVHP